VLFRFPAIIPEKQLKPYIHHANKSQSLLSRFVFSSSDCHFPTSCWWYLLYSPPMDTLWQYPSKDFYFLCPLSFHLLAFTLNRLSYTDVTLIVYLLFLPQSINYAHPLEAQQPQGLKMPFPFLPFLVIECPGPGHLFIEQKAYQVIMSRYSLLQACRKIA